ncbi:RNase A-like domain-containing protein [Streptomyces sp. NPDC004012]
MWPATRGREPPSPIPTHWKSTWRSPPGTCAPDCERNPNEETVSRYVDKASAQKASDGVVLKHQKEIDAWLAKNKSRKLELETHFDDPTGLSLSRVNFVRGDPPEWVTGARVILKRDPSAEMGYRVLTSYPIP